MLLLLLQACAFDFLARVAALPSLRRPTAERSPSTVLRAWRCCRQLSSAVVALCRRLQLLSTCWFASSFRLSSEHSLLRRCDERIVAGAVTYPDFCS